MTDFLDSKIQSMDFQSKLPRWEVLGRTAATIVDTTRLVTHEICTEAGE
jgi:hypothetical protein